MPFKPGKYINNAVPKYNNIPNQRLYIVSNHVDEIKSIYCPAQL